MNDYEKRLKVLHQSPTYPDIADACRVAGRNGDSSSGYWIMNEHIFYLQGLNWYLMTAYNEWELSDFGDDLYYGDVDCVFPVPMQMVVQYGFSFAVKQREDHTIILNS